MPDRHTWPGFRAANFVRSFVQI